MHRLTAALALALAAGAASAQSFNLDFEASGAPGSGVPAVTYGGPAASPGMWNPISTASIQNVTLSRLDGVNNGDVTLTHPTNGSFNANNSAATTGNCEKLLDDYQFITSGTLTYTFNGLANGTYAVYVCGVDPASVSNVGHIQVVGAQSSSVATQTIGGTMVTDTFRAGITHSVHFKNVTDGHITINVSSNAQNRGVISGIQIVKLTSSTQRLRLYVDKSAAGANDGSSWANAMPDLQQALDAASLGGGQHFEVWVASQFYTPGTARTSTFNVDSGLKLYGGFAGTEQILAQRTNPLGNLTYLTGSIGSSAATDDVYTVVTLNGCDSSTEVDGFFIARAYNNGSGHGGGMAISGGAPRIRNCDFTTNSASAGGAAIYSNNSYPVIVSTTFYKGDAYNGVGGAIEAAGNGALTVQNCRFLGNQATGEGGAVYTGGQVFSEFTNCLFSGNSTSFQAGAIKSGGTSGTMTLRNCTLSMNSSTGTCGGIYASGGNDVVLRNSIIWGNTGGNGASIVDQGFLAAGGSTITSTFTTRQGISSDPLFISAAGGDGIPGNFDDNCHIRQGSSAMDNADVDQLPNDIDDLDHNGIMIEPIPVDLDGNSRRVEILTSLNTGNGLPPLDRGCYEFQLGSWCYANCNDSTTSPVLNVQDFTCFINKFGSGDPYANCDGSIVEPTLNVQDFTCFLNKFAAGCP